MYTMKMNGILNATILTQTFIPNLTLLINF